MSFFSIKYGDYRNNRGANKHRARIINAYGYTATKGGGTIALGKPDLKERFSLPKPM